MSRRSTGLGAVGVAVLAATVAVAFVPDAVLAGVPGVQSVIAAVDGGGGRLALGVVGGLLTTLAWYFAGTGGRARTDTVLDVTRAQPPECVAVDPRTVTGGGMDAAYAAAHTRDAADSVRDALRTRAIRVERAVSGVDRSTAVRRVDTGEWTDDRLAAGVVSRETPIPVFARLRGWLDPRGETNRRVRRTLDALDRRLADRARSPPRGDDAPTAFDGPRSTDDLSSDVEESIDDTVFGGDGENG